LVKIVYIPNHQLTQIWYLLYKHDSVLKISKYVYFISAEQCAIQNNNILVRQAQHQK